ncbi:hypothetical protein ACQZ48_20300 [Agrobacterium sp. 22-209-1]
MNSRLFVAIRLASNCLFGSCIMPIQARGYLNKEGSPVEPELLIPFGTAADIFLQIDDWQRGQLTDRRNPFSRGDDCMMVADREFSYQLTRVSCGDHRESGCGLEFH